MRQSLALSGAPGGDAGGARLANGAKPALRSIQSSCYSWRLRHQHPNLVFSRNQAVSVIRRAGPYLAVLTVGIACAVRLIYLADRYSVNIFFGDQWQFNEATVFQTHSLIEIFRWQHGPHRQGMGGVLSKLLEPFIRWNSRYEAFGIVAIICVSAVLALWLKQRLFGRISYSDIAIPLLFLTPIQYQVFLEIPNPSHGPLPLLLIVSYCLCWTIQSVRWRLTGLLLVNLLLIYTGFGLLMGFITPILVAIEYLWLRTDRLCHLSAFAIAALSMASFFIGYRYWPAVDCFSPSLRNPFYYLLFIGFMLSTFVGIFVRQALVPAILTGLLLLGVFAVSVPLLLNRFYREKQTNFQLNMVIFALLVYSSLFAFATAYGRVCIGLSQAQESRYSTYLILAFFGLYLGSVSAKLRFERAVFVSIVLVFATLSSLKVRESQYQAMTWLHDHKLAWKECYMALHDITRCDLETGVSIYNSPEPPDLQSKLNVLEAKHWNLYSGDLTAEKRQGPRR